MVVSPLQGLASLGEQRGDGDPSAPWTGTQDRNVALLADLARCLLRGGFDGLAELVDALLALLDLLVDQTQARDQGADMSGCGINRARRHREWRLAQHAQHLCGVEAAYAMVLVVVRDCFLARPLGICGGRMQFPESVEQVYLYVLC